MYYRGRPRAKYLVYVLKRRRYRLSATYKKKSRSMSMLIYETVKRYSRSVVCIEARRGRCCLSKLVVVRAHVAVLEMLCDLADCPLASNSVHAQDNEIHM